jgi:hypothetical protein
MNMLLLFFPHFHLLRKWKEVRHIFALIVDMLTSGTTPHSNIKHLMVVGKVILTPAQETDTLI